MLIQNLRFFEVIDNLDDIKGGTSSSTSSVNPGANANASAGGGDLNYAMASTTGTDGSSTKEVALGITEIEILELDLIKSFPGIDVAVIDLY